MIEYTPDLENPTEQHYETFEGVYVGKGIDWTHQGDRVIQTPSGETITESDLSYSLVECKCNPYKRVEE